MPIGEIILESGLRLILEIVLYGITYWPGFFILKLLSFGEMNRCVLP